MDLLSRLLTPVALPRYEDVAAFRAALDAVVAAAGPAAPVDRALLAGHLADRLGYAFAGGYAAALSALVPDLTAPACLCVTEEGGAHPRAIHTRIEADRGGWRLHGRKQWATLADAGQELLVAASAGSEGGRNRLVVVRVPATAAGLALTPMGETPFVPEIGHFHVRLDGVWVPADAVLPGDGYERYIKPFRTVEDVHVLAAAAAYLLAVARRSGWDASHVEALLAAIVGLRGVAGEDPTALATHLALAGVMDATHAAIAALGPAWTGADADERQRWERDAPLLRVAGGARQARREAARARLG